MVSFCCHDITVLGNQTKVYLKRKVSIILTSEIIMIRLILIITPAVTRGLISRGAGFKFGFLTIHDALSMIVIYLFEIWHSSSSIQRIATLRIRKIFLHVGGNVECN